MTRRRRQSPRGRRPRRRRWGRRLAWSILAAAILVVGALGWFAYAGLPDAVSRYLLQQLEARGVRVRASRLSVRPLRGVVASDVEIGPARRTDASPWFTALRVRIGLSPGRWIVDRNPVSGFAVDGASVCVPLGEGPGTASCLLEAQDARMTVSFLPGGDWDVAEFSGRFCGIDVLAAGRVRQPPPMPGQPPADVAAARRKLAALIVRLQQVRLDAPPELEIRFDGVLGAWDTFKGDVNLRMTGAGYGAYEFDRFDLEGGFRAGALELRRLRLASGSSILEAEGVYAPSTGQGDVRVRGELAWDQLVAWLPESLVSRGSAETVEVRLHLGPGRLRPDAGRAEGELILRNAWLQGVDFRRASAGIRYVPGLLLVEGIEARQENGRVLEGDAAYEPSTGDWGARLRGTVAFNDLAPWSSAEVGDVLASARADGGSRWTLESCGLAGEGGSSVWRGGCTLLETTFSGVYFERADLDFHYDGRHLDFDRVNLEREEGKLNGAVSFDFRENVLTFDVGSSLEPRAIARLLGDHEVAIVRPYRFETPPIVSATGSFAYGRPEASRARVRISGENLHWWHVVADRASTELFVDGRRLRLDPLELSGYGGTAEATLAFDFAHDPPAFEVSGEILEPLDFERLLEDMAKVPVDTRGKLAGAATVSGILGEPSGFTGRGRLALDDGLIWRLALFGDLSRLIGRILPGVGFSRPYRADGTFTLRDGWAESRDLTFRGDLLSLEFEGRCGLDGALDYVIRAHMLRETMIAAELIGLFFEPFLGFMEFDLEGTLSDPVYRPRSLPKELFGED